MVLHHEGEPARGALDIRRTGNFQSRARRGAERLCHRAEQGGLQTDRRRRRQQKPGCRNRRTQGLARAGVAPDQGSRAGRVGQVLALELPARTEPEQRRVATRVGDGPTTGCKQVQHGTAPRYAARAPRAPPDAPRRDDRASDPKKVPCRTPRLACRTPNRQPQQSTDNRIGRESFPSDVRYKIAKQVPHGKHKIGSPCQNRLWGCQGGAAVVSAGSESRFMQRGKCAGPPNPGLGKRDQVSRSKRLPTRRTRPAISSIVSSTRRSAADRSVRATSSSVERGVPSAPTIRC